MDKIMYLWHRLSNKYLKRHHSYLHQLKNSKTINIYTHTYIWFWRYLTRGLIWHLNQSFIRPSIYFSLIVKSRSNSFLEKTVTRVKFLAQLNNGSLRWGSNPWLIKSEMPNPLCHSIYIYIVYEYWPETTE